MPAERRVVGAVIVDSLERPRAVLAARRSYPPGLNGRWEFPGGKVEPGEPPERALARELAEELHISVILGAEIRPPTAHTWWISEKVSLRLWFAEIVEGEPLPGESHDEIAWLDANTLESVDWLAADRAAVPVIRSWLFPTGRFDDEPTINRP